MIAQGPICVDTVIDQAVMTHQVVLVVPMGSSRDIIITTKLINLVQICSKYD